MNARVMVPQGALAVIDSEKRAKRAIRCVEDRMALSPDGLLHELQDTLAADGISVRLTAGVRGFLRAIAKRLEGER